MTKAAFRQIAVTRAIRGAVAAGWTQGSFKVIAGRDGEVTILPIDAAADEAADLEKRMKEAFGE